MINKYVLKLFLWSFLFLSLTPISSQELYVSSSGAFYVNSKALVSVNDITVSSEGTVSFISDNTNSPSLFVSGSATGVVTYERYVGDTNWHVFSSPVTSQSINDFALNANNNIATNGAKYAIGAYKNANNSNARWDYFTTATAPEAGNFITGQGYTFKKNAAGTFVFMGNVATSDVTVSLNTLSGGHYWHGVGNPFTAFLPVNNNTAVTNLLGQNLEVFDPSYAALYLWDGAEYVPVNHLSDALQLAPGQAFMVRVKDASENFTFSKSLVTHQTAVTTLYKGISIPSVTLQLKENSVVKTASIKFLESATLGLDVGYDAGAYQNSKPSFAIHTHLVENDEGVDYTLQALPNNRYDDLVIPLSVYATSGTTIELQAIPENLPENIPLYIEDKVLQTFKKVSDSASYQVTLSETIAGIGRFYLHTSAGKSLAVEEAQLLSVHIFITDTNVLRVHGIIPGKKASIALYSLLGKEIFSSAFVASDTHEIILPNTISKGVYVVKVTSDTGLFSTKKIVLQ